jgi:hypothetical protein
LEKEKNRAPKRVSMPLRLFVSRSKERRGVEAKGGGQKVSIFSLTSAQCLQSGGTFVPGGWKGPVEWGRRRASRTLERQQHRLEQVYSL